MTHDLTDSIGFRNEIILYKIGGGTDLMKEVRTGPLEVESYGKIRSIVKSFERLKSQ